MVARTSVVVSPVAEFAPRAPVAATLHPRSSLVKPSASRLERLFRLGEGRFECGDDKFVDVYCRTIQAALRGNAWRNKRMENELRALRAENKAMRAAKVEKKIVEKAVQGGGDLEQKEIIYQAKIINGGAKNINVHNGTTMRKCGADARQDDTTGSGFPRTA